MSENNSVLAKLDQQNNSPVKRIRSFVRRQGRLTKGQQLALNECWATKGIIYQRELLDLTRLFKRDAPVILEIGFGMGASLVQMAKMNPEKNFLGIDVHLPGIGACLQLANKLELNNLRVIHQDAVEVLENMLADDSLTAVQLFFPDPWHKTRHHKRRILQTPFAELVQRKLKLGGLFHMATDWQNYAKQMLDVMSMIDGYHNLSNNNSYIPRPDSRPLTKFEQRGQRLGHGIWDLMFERIK